MLYLASLHVERQEYMEEGSAQDKVHLVEAASEDEARELLEEAYEKNSEPYAVSYSIYIQSIMPVLSKSNIDEFWVD